MFHEQDLPHLYLYLFIYSYIYIYLSIHLSFYLIQGYFFSKDRMDCRFCICFIFVKLFDQSLSQTKREQSTYIISVQTDNQNLIQRFNMYSQNILQILTT